MKLLLDEMYSPALAKALVDVGVDAITVKQSGMAGRSDLDILETAIEQGRTVLTENVADFRRISAEHLDTGRHHAGVVIALSTRFSRGPTGIGPLVAAIRAVAGQTLDDLVIFLERAEG